MKLPILLILLVFLPTLSQSQNATITIGRGTDCFGRGACSISTENSENYNSTLFQNPEGLIILRVHRSKLDQMEEDRIFGEPITPFNINHLQFEMVESISLDENVSFLTSTKKSDQISGISKGFYPTVISDQFVDIVIMAINESSKPE